MQLTKTNPEVAPNQRPIESVLCLPPEFERRLRLDPIAGCWIWTGALFAGTGYGSFTFNGQHWRAHRFSWTFHYGPIPDKLHVLHICDTPACVNPNHLFLGTAKDNHQDKARKGRHWQQKKTHCPYGHPYNEENTWRNSLGHRKCRTCKTVGRFVLTSLLLVALLTPASPQKAAHMFVLSEIARKSYAQFSFDFETSVTGKKSKTEVSSQSPEPPVVSNVPSALDHLAAKYRPFINRVMARLSEAERHEVNLHYQADYRQSWICLSFANKGLADPFVSASYQMYGIHPDKVWERIVADRKERLGAEYYDWYSSDDLLRPDVPKIPPTATADSHAANGADLLTGQVGSVPINKEVV